MKYAAYSNIIMAFIINIWFGHVIHIELILFRLAHEGKIEWMMAVAGGKYAKMPVCTSLNCYTLYSAQCACSLRNVHCVVCLIRIFDGIHTIL